ncbi:DUF2125 domain-containing protein [Pseudophaeobacter sp.]|uniref:DUF2125 domain-containing protein n=1 Tax=Pseudophaeobacter sp. TaxID=1971739 RepID=UPI003296DFF4
MRLLKWLGLGAAVWIIYWGVAAWGLRSGLESWFGEQQRQGWQVEHGALQTSGFPSRHVTRIDQVVLADPGTGAAWSADWMEFDSPALWPGSQTLRLPATAQRFSFFDQTRTLQAQEMQAELQLAPGLALELERLALTAKDWQVSKGTEVHWQAQDLTLVLAQQDPATHYQLSASATGFAPSGAFRRMSQLSDTLPQRFDSLQVQASVQFDTPWDRRAIELRRPQPRAIDLQLVEAHWGEMRFKATGQLQVDERGRLTGELTLQAQNWRAILDMAERASLLPPSTRNALEQVLALFAGETGSQERLNTTLSFDQGQIWIGPLPIGTAPTLVIR